MLSRGVAARWFGKIAMLLWTLNLRGILTIVEIPFLILAGEWQEKAAETVATRGSVSSDFHCRSSTLRPG